MYSRLDYKRRGCTKQKSRSAVGEKTLSRRCAQVTLACVERSRRFQLKQSMERRGLKEHPKISQPAAVVLRPKAGTGTRKMRYLRFFVDLAHLCVGELQTNDRRGYNNMRCMRAKPMVGALSHIIGLKPKQQLVRCSIEAQGLITTRSSWVSQKAAAVKLHCGQRVRACYYSSRFPSREAS